MRDTQEHKNTNHRRQQVEDMKWCRSFPFYPLPSYLATYQSRKGRQSQEVEQENQTERSRKRKAQLQGKLLQ